MAASFRDSPGLANKMVTAFLKSDLLRSFAIGFALGAVAVCVILAVSDSGLFSGGMVPSAVAAPAR